MFSCMCMYMHTCALQDFGDYESAHSRGMYHVKTSEGEAIGQLLEGYIHLIMEAVSIYCTSGLLIPTDHIPL